MLRQASLRSWSPNLKRAAVGGSKVRPTRWREDMVQDLASEHIVECVVHRLKLLGAKRTNRVTVDSMLFVVDWPSNNIFGMQAR